MERTGSKERGFTGFDYKAVCVDCSQVSMYLDGYECFGWQTDENQTGVRERDDLSIYYKRERRTSTIYLKRDRKIMNKTELTRLQKHFEDCAQQIRKLEMAKTRLAMIVAITVALIGCAFFAGSVFAITAEQPLIFLCVVLGIPGAICWILPFFLYGIIRKIKTEQLNPMIEEKQDEMYEICDKGNKLLY